MITKMKHDVILNIGDTSRDSEKGQSLDIFEY